MFNYLVTMFRVASEAAGPAGRQGSPQVGRGRSRVLLRQVVTDALPGAHDPPPHTDRIHSRNLLIRPC
jgi:hypothetical protein